MRLKAFTSDMAPEGQANLRSLILGKKGCQARTPANWSRCHLDCAPCPSRNTNIRAERAWQPRARAEMGHLRDERELMELPFWDIFKGLPVSISLPI